MKRALAEAQRASDAGEVPVGAIITFEDRIIGRAHNQVELLKDPTAHAEVLAITQATQALEDWRLLDTCLYVTKEPCPMCAGAIMLARIPTVVYGVPDPVRGGAASVFNILDNPAMNHRATLISGILENDCRAILKSFFKDRRKT